MRKVTSLMTVLAAVLPALLGCAKDEPVKHEAASTAQPASAQGTVQPAPGIPQMPTTPEEALRLQNAPPLAAGETELPPGHPPIPGTKGDQAPPAGSPPQGELTGTVLDTMDAAGYTYVQVKTDQATVWLAGPATKVGKGDGVVTAGGMLMHNFRSKTLDRTFPEIYFVNRIEVRKP